MTDIEEIKEDIKTIKELLLGNGKIGNISKVQIMWKCGIFVIFVIVSQTIMLFYSYFK